MQSKEAWERAAADQFRIYQRANRRAERRGGTGLSGRSGEAWRLERELYPSAMFPAVIHPSFVRRWRERRYG